MTARGTFHFLSPAGPRASTQLAVRVALPLAIGCTGTIAEPPGPEGRSPDTSVTVVDDEGRWTITPEPAAMMRLTEAQYRNSLEDVFGPEVLPTEARLPPDRTGDDFPSIAAAEVSTSRRGVELYQAAALEVAARVWEHRERFVELGECTPTVASDPCIARVLEKYGERLFRRPLASTELTRLTDLVVQATQWPDAEAIGIETALGLGMQYALAALIASPSFLYVARSGEPDPVTGGYRVTSLEMASRLAYFLWDSTPDEELLERAKAGALTDPAQIRLQVRRMLDTPRGEELVVRFFEQNWNVDRLPQAAKDPDLFPEWTSELAEAARTEFRLVLHELASDSTASILEVFNRRRTFVNAPLAALYEADVTPREGFAEVVLDDRRAGLLTSVAVLASNAKPNRTSPTQRGVFLRWRALCLPVPPPDPSVMTELVEAGGDSEPQTIRELLEQHRSRPECAACHELFDPMGLVLEGFDAIGRFREIEQGMPIDPTAEFEGIHLDDARSLADFLRSDPRAARCLASKLFTYASGHVPTPGEEPAIDHADEEFAAASHTFRALVEAIATSPAFRYVAVDAEEEQ